MFNSGIISKLYFVALFASLKPHKIQNSHLLVIFINRDICTAKAKICATGFGQSTMGSIVFELNK